MTSRSRQGQRPYSLLKSCSLSSSLPPRFCHHHFPRGSPSRQVLANEPWSSSTWRETSHGRFAVSTSSSILPRPGPRDKAPSCSTGRMLQRSRARDSTAIRGVCHAGSSPDTSWSRSQDRSSGQRAWPCQRISRVPSQSPWPRD